MTDLDALAEISDAFATHPEPQSSKRLRMLAKFRRARNKMGATPLWLRQLRIIKASKARHSKAST